MNQNTLISATSTQTSQTITSNREPHLNSGSFDSFESDVIPYQDYGVTHTFIDKERQQWPAEDAYVVTVNQTSPSLHSEINRSPCKIRLDAR